MRNVQWKGDTVNVPHDRISDPGPRIFKWATWIMAIWLTLEGALELTGVLSPPSRAWSSWLTLTGGIAFFVTLMLERRKPGA
jgi:hypothetical protein